MLTSQIMTLVIMHFFSFIWNLVSLLKLSLHMQLSVLLLESNPARQHNSNDLAPI
jgi:hypothetical protein